MAKEHQISVITVCFGIAHSNIAFILYHDDDEASFLHLILTVFSLHTNSSVIHSSTLHLSCLNIVHDITQLNATQYNTLQYRGTVQADGVGQDRRTVPPRCRAHARLLGGAGCAQRLHLSPEQTLSILPDTRWLLKYLKVSILTCSLCSFDLYFFPTYTFLLSWFVRLSSLSVSVSFSISIFFSRPLTWCLFFLIILNCFSSSFSVLCTCKRNPSAKTSQRGSSAFP